MINSTNLTNHKLAELYEIDSYLWLDKNIELLKISNFTNLDIANLIEELEDLGRSE